MLGTHNLTIGYKGKDGFTRAIPDLRFRAGEITGLMGNNGCGKTTLVRTLTDSSSLFRAASSSTACPRNRAT